MRSYLCINSTSYSFKQRSNEIDYVIIDPVNYPLSCHSTIGKKGGPQKVRCGNCKVDGVFHYGRILHELFHVVGKVLITFVHHFP